MAFVLDASVAVAIVLEGEELSDPQPVFELVATLGAIAPSVWRLEVANALLVAMRRGRIDAIGCWTRLNDLDALGIRIDQVGLVGPLADTALIAERHGLTAYDAAYLELALRESVPLATLDDPLKRAARAEMVELVLG